MEKDLEVVLEARRNHEAANAQRDMNSAVWKDRHFVIEAVKQDHNSLAYADSGFFSDPAVLAANPNLARLKSEWMGKVGQDGMQLENAPAYFKANRGIVMKAVKVHGEALQFAAELLKKERQ